SRLCVRQRSIVETNMIRSSANLTKLFATIAISTAVFLLLADCQLVVAQDSDEPKKSLADVLKPAIEAHHGEVGIAVKHLKTGETYEYKADQAMPTASLIK